MRKSVAALRTASLTAVAALTVAISVAACGSSTTATTAQAQASGAPQAGAAMGGPSSMFSSQLAALVTKGTITAAQQKSIVAALKSSMGSAMPGGQGGQPSAGTTPGAQPSTGATPGAQMQGGPPDMSSLFTTALDPLVKAGTITSAQETAVIAALSTRPQGAPTGAQPSAQPTSQSSSTTQI